MKNVQSKSCLSLLNKKSFTAQKKMHVLEKKQHLFLLIKCFEMCTPHDIRCKYGRESYVRGR